jgi:DNA-binding NarL/FixJ family response regulator
MIRSILADDHDIFRQGLVMLMKTLPEIVVIGQAGDGLAAERLIMEATPDLAVMDISMPGQDGLQVIKNVKKLGVNTKCILLTMHNDPKLAAQALLCGADGFLLKESAFDDLKQAISKVMCGIIYISPKMVCDIILDNKSVEQKNLTPREQEILICIASGLTNPQIARQLYISVKTVETHRSRIMKKLDLHTIADLVRYSIKTGLIQP